MFKSNGARRERARSGTQLRVGFATCVTMSLVAALVTPDAGLDEPTSARPVIRIDERSTPASHTDSGAVVRLSVNTDGVAANATTSGGAFSQDNQQVAFTSEASNLVSGDTNGVSDVYVKDLHANTIERISVSSTGTQTGEHSGLTEMTPDARYVLFETEGGTLVSGDGNMSSGYGGNDVFIRDRQAQTTERVSLGDQGQELGYGGSGADISDDGRYVVFGSTDNTVVTGQNDSGTDYDLFLRDRVNNSTMLISRNSAGAAAGGDSFGPAISGDGRFIAFSSTSTTLVPNDTATEDIFMFDRDTNSITKITNGIGALANGASNRLDISRDGRYVTFLSVASNLVAGDTNAKMDVFRYDRQTGAIQRAVSGGETTGQIGGGIPRLSADGSRVVWATSSKFAYGDTNSYGDIYLRDFEEGFLSRISVTGMGNEVNNASQGQMISPDGQFASFDTRATQVVDGDTSTILDSFINDIGASRALAPVGQTFGSPGSAVHAANPTKEESDPVNMASGAYSTSVTDLALPGVGPGFSLTRSYTSADTSSGPLGAGWSHSYDAHLQITSTKIVLHAENGQRVSYAVAPSGAITPLYGATSTLAPATGGGYTLTRRDHVTYKFDAAGKLTRINFNNHEINLTYTNGHLSQVEDTVGRQINFVHQNGRLTSVTLPDGRNVQYGYTGDTLTSVVDVLGGTSTYEYDSSNRIIKAFDQANRRRITNHYGADGRVERQTDPFGRDTTFEWDPATGESTMTNPRGEILKQIYENNVLVEEEDPPLPDNSTRITTYKFDGRLNLISVKNPKNVTTTMTYDKRGNLLTTTTPVASKTYTRDSSGAIVETNATNVTQTFTYDAANDLTSVQDALGRVTTFDYDDYHNLLSITKGTHVTTFTRDPIRSALVLEITDARGHKRTFEHDDDGNVIGVTTHLGRKETFTYDTSGRMLSAVDGRGNVSGFNPDNYRTIFTYDAANRLRTQTDPLGNVEEWTYDEVGNVKKHINANLETTNYTYDALDRITSVTAPGATIPTSYVYDDLLNTVTKTNPRGNDTKYYYGASGELQKILSELGREWTYAYDAAGHLKTVVTPIGNATPTISTDGKIDYSVDGLGRPITVNYSDSTPDVTLTYDKNGNRSSMSSSVATEKYFYDEFDRLAEVENAGTRFLYSYDAVGNLVNRSVPGGASMDYTFDEDDQMTAVTVDGQTTSFAYTAAGDLRTTTFPAANGHVQTTGWDRARRMTNVTTVEGTTTRAKRIYTLDPVGNPTAINDGTATINYDYNVRGMVTEACYTTDCSGANDLRWSYDTVGNRLKEFRSTTTKTYTYDEDDKLDTESRTNPSRIYAHSYDLNGNQLTDDVYTYTYDLANRTKTIAKTATPTDKTTYVYDGLGKRVQATGTTGTPSTKFEWDINSSVPRLSREKDAATGSAIRRYTYAGDQLINMRADGASYYYHPDKIGSTLSVTSASGTPQWTFEYEPFGVRTATKNNTTAPATTIGFAGQFRDPETGSIHMRARQYDPGTGRFNSLDPMAPSPHVPAGSPYAYVANNPLVATDPTGLFCVLGHNPNGSCRGTGAATRIGHVARFGINAPKTVVAAGWANLNGGSCDMEYGLIVACYDVNAWANGPAPHVTIGNTVLTEWDEKDFKSDEGLMEHEVVHATQWALDPLFPLNYAKESIKSVIETGDPACGNEYERDAGLERGNYTHCVP